MITGLFSTATKNKARGEQGDGGMDRQERDGGGSGGGGSRLFPVRVQVYISVIWVKTLSVGEKNGKKQKQDLRASFPRASWTDYYAPTTVSEKGQLPPVG